MTNSAAMKPPSLRDGLKAQFNRPINKNTNATLYSDISALKRLEGQVGPFLASVQEPIDKQDGGHP